MTHESYKFDIKSQHTSIIKVIGVGGGGGNAINYMYAQGIQDVEFIICNTDAQVLKNSPVPNKLQIGANLTGGLGAGTDPEKGRQAALEDKDLIRESLDNTKMLFVNAGMGGGTGTGAAPVIAELAKDMDILTVGIVTMPFVFEGKKKRQIAEEGVAALKKHCDTVIIILNDKIKEIHGNLSLKNAFSKADDILSTASKSIAEIITKPGDLNIDFSDVNTVMNAAGPAVMGSSVSYGQDRAINAAEAALNSPLLNNTDIKGASKILVSITVADNEAITMDEFAEINDYFQDTAGYDALLKCGVCIDENMGESIQVTVIATGFDSDKNRTDKEDQKRVIDLNSNRQISIFEKEGNQQTTQTSNYENAELETSKGIFNYGNAEDKVVIDINGDYVDKARDEEGKAGNDPYMDYEKKKNLEQKYKERSDRLSRLNAFSNLNSEELNERYEVPAYKRKNVKLNDVKYSSDDHNVSRFNLNDDNEILGNNRFLHDNVD